VLVVDTSGVLAALNRADSTHDAVREVIEAERGPLVVPDLVIPEIDYLVLQYLGRKAEEAFLADLLSGFWVREPLEEQDLVRAVALLKRFRDHDIGIVDASIVATAERLQADRILTLDRRHFRTFRMRDRKAFTLLPG